jgi:hypothetical protein
VTVYSYEQPATGVNQYVNRKCREPSSLRSMLRCAQPELSVAAARQQSTPTELRQGPGTQLHEGRNGRLRARMDHVRGSSGTAAVSRSVHTDVV